MIVYRCCVGMKHVNGISRFISFSARTLCSASASAFHARNPVRLLLSRVGNRKASIIPVLHGWLQEGGNLTPSNLEDLSRALRAKLRYKQALEVLEWMAQERNDGLSFSHTPMRLDLISKVYGLEQAEKYFGNIPDAMKVKQVYGALLNCYAHCRCLEKAEATMQLMRDLGFATDTLSYNVMLKLYVHLKRYEKLDPLLQEMQEKGIEFDAYTYNTRLVAYASASDIEGMEKFLTKMEADPCIPIDWHAYVAAANGYVKANQPETAAKLLNRAEQGISNINKSQAYEILLTMYANIGRKDDACRILKLYKDIGKLRSPSYVLMISSLVKLDDLDAAKKIAEEWESRYSDPGVPRLLIKAYCDKGLLEKAEAYVDKLIESGKVIDTFMWNSLATACKNAGKMEKAAENLKKAILASPQFQPNYNTLAACLDHLKNKGSIEVSEELVNLLRNKGHLSPTIFGRLLNNVRERNLDAHSLDVIRGVGDSLDGEASKTNGVQA